MRTMEARLAAAAALRVMTDKYTIHNAPKPLLDVIYGVIDAVSPDTWGDILYLMAESYVNGQENL